VTTDDSVRGVAKKKLWIAATECNLAVDLVLPAVPEDGLHRLRWPLKG